MACAIGNDPSAWGETRPLTVEQVKLSVCHPVVSMSLPTHLATVMKGVVIVQNDDHIGSGVLISRNGYILTAGHLVKKNGDAAVYLNSGDTVLGHVVRMDVMRDIALVKIPGNSHPCLKMSDALAPIGSRIFSIGFLPQRNARFIVGEGIIRAHPFIEEKKATYLQTSLDLKPGSSGGPLLNRQGEVVGLISWKLKTDDQGTYSYSLPAKTAGEALHIGWQRQ